MPQKRRRGSGMFCGQLKTVRGPNLARWPGFADH